MEIFKNALEHFGLANKLMEDAFSVYSTAKNEFSIVGGIDGFCIIKLRDVERNVELRRLQTIFQWTCVHRHVKYLSLVMIDVLFRGQLCTKSMDIIQDAQEAITNAEVRCLRISLELNIPEVVPSSTGLTK